MSPVWAVCALLLCLGCDCYRQAVGGAGFHLPSKGLRSHGGVPDLTEAVYLVSGGRSPFAGVSPGVVGRWSKASGASMVMESIRAGSHKLLAS